MPGQLAELARLVVEPGVAGQDQHPDDAQRAPGAGERDRRPRLGPATATVSQRVEERRTRVPQWLGHATTLRAALRPPGDLGSLGERLWNTPAMSDDWPPEPPPPPEPTGPPGPGWWLASDGRYYPPEQAPGRPLRNRLLRFTAYTPYAPGMAQATSTNGLAIASMVLGILWIWWIGSILALVFGYVAKGQIDRSAGRQGGRGMAIAGIVLGWIGVAFLALFIVFAIAFGDDVDDFDGINSDPSDGVCNEDRVLQDPDC